MKKTAVVTGASRGIGRAAAIALAKDFNVVVNCRKNIDLAEKTAEEIIKKEALAASADVCKILPAKLGDSIGDYAALSVAAMNRKNG